MEGHTNTLESKESILKSYVKLGTEKALGIIKKEFEDTREEHNRLAYHNRVHTEEVLKRASLILSTIKEFTPKDAPLASDHDIEIMKLASSFHDVVQEWEEKVVDEENGQKKIRKKMTGGNENKSIDALVEFMDEANEEEKQKTKQPVFTLEDKELAREAITVTIPGFDEEKNIFVQPNLKEDSKLVAVAIALADLGACGMDGPEVFLREGDALFREDNIDMINLLDNPSLLTDQQKKYLSERMIAWSRGQIAFAKSRKELFKDEMKYIPEIARAEVNNLFNKFDASIDGAEKQFELRSVMNFEDLAKDMGYMPS